MVNLDIDCVPILFFHLLRKDVVLHGAWKITIKRICHVEHISLDSCLRFTRLQETGPGDIRKNHQIGVD